MPVRLGFRKIFSPKPSPKSANDDGATDASSTTQSRSSTGITALEEKFGMREPPKSGLLSKLHVPKREKPTAQAPEPHRRPSFLQGSWATLWASEEQNFQSGLDEDVATPTNVIASCSDGERTPLASYNLQRTPSPDAFEVEDDRAEESSSGTLHSLASLERERPPLTPKQLRLKRSRIPAFAFRVY